MIDNEVLQEVKRLEKLQLLDIMRINEIEKQLPDYLTDEQIDDILFAIQNDIPIIIGGKQGKTGKTTLTNILRENNITVYEKWECLEIELNNKLD